MLRPCDGGHGECAFGIDGRFRRHESAPAAIRWMERAEGECTTRDIYRCTATAPRCTHDARSSLSGHTSALPITQKKATNAQKATKPRMKHSARNAHAQARMTLATMWAMALVRVI